MPGFDGTGPRGQGPRTGGGFGYCPPWGGYGRSYSGYGRGGGRGRGRCRGGWWDREMPFPPYPYPQEAPARDEMAYLEEMKAGLEEELKNLSMRLDELARRQADKKTGE